MARVINFGPRLRGLVRTPAWAALLILLCVAPCLRVADALEAKSGSGGSSGGTITTSSPLSGNGSPGSPATCPNCATTNAANSFTVGPQTVAPASTSQDAVDINMPASTTGNAVAVKNSGGSTLFAVPGGAGGSNASQVASLAAIPIDTTSDAFFANVPTSDTAGNCYVCQDNSVTRAAISQHGQLFSSPTETTIVPFQANGPTSMTADLINLQVNSTLEAKIDHSGNLTVKGQITDGAGGVTITNPAGSVWTTGLSSTQGNGTKFQLSTGTTTSGDYVKFDANGNTIDSGSGPWVGPQAVAYEGTGHASGTPLTLNAYAGVSASNDLVVVFADTSTGGGAATLTCSPSCTNTFTKRLTDFNAFSGEFYTLWTGLAGSETSYSVADSGNNVYAMSMTVLHKSSGVTAWDAINSNSSAAGSGVYGQSATLTTTHNTATVVILNAPSGGASNALPPIGSAFSTSAGTIFPILQSFQAPTGNGAFPNQSIYAMATSGTFPVVNFAMSGGNGTGSVVYDVF